MRRKTTVLLIAAICFFNFSAFCQNEDPIKAGDLNALNGMFIPFKKTKTERLAANAPRLSLEERYHDHDGYVARVKKAANDLVSDHLLQPNDARNIITAAINSDILKQAN